VHHRQALDGRRYGLFAIRLGAGLETNSPQSTRRDVVDFPQYAGDQRSQVLHAIADRSNDEYCNWQRCHVLLVFNILIHRQEDIESACSQGQQPAVLDTCPATALHGGGFVPYKQRAEAARKVFIKQDAHLQSTRRALA
jgi:hypothetical protein